MDAILQWGLDCIRFIQTGATPPLTIIMKIITTLGSAPVYLIILPLIYWCIDEKKCLRLGTMVLISAWVNILLKVVLEQPRPFFPGYDPSVGMLSERMGGFPSGHAQTTLVMWIIIASWVNKKWYWGVTALFCLLIGFSRVYLGVHFPTDIFGGWAIGGILLAAYFLLGKRIENFLASRSPRTGLVACAALAFIMILYRPVTELAMPGAMLLGLGTGYFLNNRYVGFTAPFNGFGWASWGRAEKSKGLTLTSRFIFGMAGFAFLNLAIEKLTTVFTNSENYHLVVFLGFALLSIWVTAGAPWLFRFLHLAKCEIKNDTKGSADNG